MPPPEPPPPAAEEKPAVKFSLKPKAFGGAPMPAPAEMPPPPPADESAPAGDAPLVLDAPPPVQADSGAGGEPAEAAATSPGAGMPFPPPGGRFPPPPGLKKNLEAAEQEALAPKPVVGRKPVAKGGKNKKFIMLGAGSLAALVLLAAAFWGYRKMTAEPPPPPPRPKPVIKPKPVETVVEKPKVEAPAPKPVEVVAEKPVDTTPAVVVPVAPPPPPPPTAAFKQWVENAKIMGVRAGATTRVFIGGTAYAIGDLVNPQLGILFEGYNAETRMLLFKDKSGATVERRN